MEITTKNNTLEKCFETDEDYLTQAENWFIELKKVLNRSFPKIRITNKPKKSEINDLLKEKKILMEKLKNKIDKVKTTDNIKNIEDKISFLSAEKNKKLIEEHVSSMSDMDGGFCGPNMWKLKKRIFPNVTGVFRND